MGIFDFFNKRLSNYKLQINKDISAILKQIDLLVEELYEFKED